MLLIAQRSFETFGRRACDPGDKGHPIGGFTAVDTPSRYIKAAAASRLIVHKNPNEQGGYRENKAGGLIVAGALLLPC